MRYLRHCLYLIVYTSAIDDNALFIKAMIIILSKWKEVTCYKFFDAGASAYGICNNYTLYETPFQELHYEL